MALYAGASFIGPVDIRPMLDVFLTARGLRVA